MFIEERRQAAGLSSSDGMDEDAAAMEAKLAELDEESEEEDENDSDDEENNVEGDTPERTVEEDLEHIQSLFNEAQDSWKEAEERLKQFHGVVLASKRKIQVQKSRKLEIGGN